MGDRMRMSNEHSTGIPGLNKENSKEASSSGKKGLRLFHS